MLRNILILFLYTTILFLSEVLYRHIFHIPSLGRYIETYVIIFLILSLFYFAKYFISRFFIGVFFISALLVNNIHYEIYQGWINGVNYLRLFTEATEVTRTGITMLGKIAPTATFSLIEIVFFLSISKFRKKSYVLSDIIFFLLISYISIRSFKTTQEFGITSNSSYCRLKANFYSVGNFLGKVLPYEIFHLSDVPAYLKDTPQKTGLPKIKNIIFIVGESASAKNVSAFGYQRNTTPFLLEQKSLSDNLLKPTYSAGTMTAISLPALFNAIPHPNGLTQIIKGSTNLFNLAKNQHYHTEFHSAQPESEMMIMNLLGLAWIDKITFPTNQGYDRTEAMNDHKLLPIFDSINLNNGNNFIVLHQRGSHGPYGALLSKEEAVFGDDSPLNNYDSTIYNTDLLIKKVYEKLKQRPEEDWILIYTSDHGQYVTDKIYNQGTTVENNYLVPTFIYTPNQALMHNINQQFKQCERLFHQQLSTLLIHLLGYDMPISACESGVINSQLLTGDTGYIEVNQQGKVNYIYPNQKQ